MRALRRWVLLVLVLLAIACGQNVHAPRGNSVGRDRIDVFNKAAAYVLAHKNGDRFADKLPDDLRPNGAMTIRVGKEKVVSFEFPSPPIDSNPVYIYVHPEVANPTQVVEEFCREHPIWHGLKKLDEPGWYSAWGQ